MLVLPNAQVSYRKGSLKSSHQHGSRISHPTRGFASHWNYLERTNDAIMKTVQRLVGDIKRKKPKHILHHRSTYILYPSDYLDATAGPLDKLDVGLLTLGLPPARRTNYQSSGATPFCVSAVYNAPQRHPRL